MVFIPQKTNAHPKFRQSKYRNKKIKFRGEWFDSLGERDRYLCLIDDEKTGKIKDLQRQVRFSLDIGGHHICDYIADFVYQTDAGRIVEDFKGVETDVFKIKKKLMFAVHGIDILVTTRKSGRNYKSLKVDHGN